MSDEVYDTLIEKLLSNPEHLQLFLMKSAPQTVWYTVCASCAQKTELRYEAKS